MKFFPANKIEACAYGKSDRTNISAPHLRGDKLIATTGKIMVVLPVEREPDDVDGYILPAVFKAARKNARGEVSIRVSGAYTLPDGSTIPRNAELDGCKFPDHEAVIPPDRKSWQRVTVNVERLSAIAQALNSASVTIEFKEGEGVCVIRPGSELQCNGRRAASLANHFAGLGVMMPEKSP